MARLWKGGGQSRRAGTPDRLSTVPGSEALGAVAVELAFDWTWIDRREHSIEFLEDTTVRRTTRVHFTLPETLVRPIPAGSLIAVPLDILRKGEVLLHSEARDAAGAMLSPLNKPSNGTITGLGLVAFFRKRIGPSFPTAAEDLLVELAREGGQAAEAALGRIRALPAFQQYFDASEKRPGPPDLRAFEAALLTNDLKLGFL